MYPAGFDLDLRTAAKRLRPPRVGGLLPFPQVWSSGLTSHNGQSGVEDAGNVARGRDHQEAAGVLAVWDIRSNQAAL